MHIYDLQELKASTNNFSSSRLIGKGSHGSVYKGILKNGNLVAIKKQSLGLQKLQDNTKLENEANILSSVHPNPCLIKLLGISHDDYGNKIIVTQYMPNGTLHDLLHVSATDLPWRKRVEIALRIAEGVRLLHESNPPVVHRDIKSANILFDKIYSATLADFGLAVRLGNEVEANKLPAGTIGYIDPSYTTPGKLSTKIDVFSYGVVLLELLSGRRAMDVRKSPPSIVEWALPLIERGRAMEVCDERIRLPRGSMARAIRRLVHVAARCVSPKESVRPTMGEIVAILESLTVEPIQLPISFRNVVFKMMGRRRFGFNGRVKDCGTCGEHDKGSGNNISKGRLLVREILADITLK
ncbi:hypothetical protein DH2020_045085 [Rehmannia glutinosa]|uniref:Protein kinase domain-containing protein n=1 Tax=Rehmannia glutinosa TaxID=99300 RepID=A0ABR0UF39_REHGL